MSGYALRPRADADLADIWRYTAQEWSVDQADRYYRGIIAALQMLGEQPSLGRACDDIGPAIADTTSPRTSCSTSCLAVLLTSCASFMRAAIFNVICRTLE